MMTASPFFTFVAIFVIAFLAPLFVMTIPALRFPTAIVEIIAGIAVGKSGLHAVATPDWMRIVTRIGLLYLMFLAGLEIRMPALLNRRKAAAISLAGGRPGAGGDALVMAAASLTVTGALALLSGHALFRLGLTDSADLCALVFATTSLGVIVPVLKETGLSERPLGQTLLLSALFADFVTVALVSVVLRAPGRAEGNPAFQVAALAGVASILYIAGRFLLQRIGYKKRVARVSQIGVRGALAIMAICGGTALALHAEVILGGFASGFVCSLLAGEDHDILRHKLEVLGYSLFLPLFFVTVGMELDLTHVRFDAVLTRLPVYVALAFAVKLGSSLVYRPFFPWRETVASGLLMSTRFTLVIAVAMIAERLQIISGTEEGTLIATAMATVLIAPLLFAGVMGTSGQTAERL